MGINLKEIMEQLRQAENRGKKQEPEISVTIKAEGEGDVELIHAVDMLMDSVTGVIERMPPHEQMMMSMMLLDCIKERMKDEY